MGWTRIESGLATKRLRVNSWPELSQSGLHSVPPQRWVLAHNELFVVWQWGQVTYCAIWGEHSRRLDGPVRNQAQFLHRKCTGIQQRWQQCRNKVKNLREYNNFIKELNSILGHRLWKNQWILKKEKQMLTTKCIKYYSTYQLHPYPLISMLFEVCAPLNSALLLASG